MGPRRRTGPSALGVLLALASAAALPALVPVPGGAAVPRTVAGVLDLPGSLAVAHDGGLLIANRGTHQIIERLPGGALRIVAGDGRRGASGDGGPATAAELDAPTGLAVAADGTLLIADSGDGRVRAVSPTGTITTVARVPDPVAVAIGPDGTRSVVDRAGIQALSSRGRVTTLIASTTSPAGDLTIGGAPTAFVPDALAVDTSGDLVVANESPKLLLRVVPGQPPVPVGENTSVAESGLAAGRGGTVAVADDGAFALDVATATGLDRVASFGRASIPGLPGVFRPSGVAVSRSGELFADTDGANGGTARPALVSVDPDGRVHLLAVGAPTEVPR